MVYVENIVWNGKRFKVLEWQDHFTVRDKLSYQWDVYAHNKTGAIRVAKLLDESSPCSERWGAV